MYKLEASLCYCFAPPLWIMKHFAPPGLNQLTCQTACRPQTWVGRKATGSPANMARKTKSNTSELGRRLVHQGPRQAVPTQAAGEKLATGKETPFKILQVNVCGKVLSESEDEKQK